MKRCLLLCLLCLLCAASALAEPLPKPLEGLVFANAAEPIALTSCYGSTQNVHPKVLYLPQGFGGHCWWMGYTPYAWGNSAEENPCIAYSDDGYTWTNIPGNPIDLPQSNVNGYLSDAHLIYRDGMLECWYRLADRGGKREVIYRKTSDDGIHWSDRQQLHDTGVMPGQLYCLSPAAIWDGTQYHIWYVVSAGTEPDSTTQYIQYCTSADGTDWQMQHRISLDYRDQFRKPYRLWHIDMLQADGAYILTAMCKGGSKDQDGTAYQTWTLFTASSPDNEHYTEPTVLLRGSSHWDKYMYRACMVKTEEGYRLYYSALNERKAHYLGVSEGQSTAQIPQ